MGRYWPETVSAPPASVIISSLGKIWMKLRPRAQYLTPLPPNKHRFCVAPMLDWTDRHERFFLRLLSRHTMLYTEMITSGALVHGDAPRHLRYHEAEHPVAIQLGGSDPADLARCAELAAAIGYDEINLNIGCPSDRVQSGRFGACLMADPLLVAECVRSMRAVVAIPVTVKCRTGIDADDNDQYLQNFISRVADAGCDTFIIHARIAILKGLSPKENRDIPPLNYPRVFGIKEMYPHLQIVLNGGLKTLQECHDVLQHVDGVMLGREVYHNPWILANVDAELYNQPSKRRSRHDFLREFLPYVQEQLDEGIPLQHMTRHILGLFHGVPGGKAFRRHLSENAFRRNSGLGVLEDAMDCVQERSWAMESEEGNEIDHA